MGKELAGFIGLGLINSYGEVNINLDSKPVAREQSRSLTDCYDLFPYWLPFPVPRSIPRNSQDLAAGPIGALSRRDARTKRGKLPLSFSRRHFSTKSPSSSCETPADPLSPRNLFMHSMQFIHYLIKITYSWKIHESTARILFLIKL